MQRVAQQALLGEAGAAVERERALVVRLDVEPQAVRAVLLERLGDREPQRRAPVAAALLGDGEPAQLDRTVVRMQPQEREADGAAVDLGDQVALERVAQEPEVLRARRRREERRVVGVGLGRDDIVEVVLARGPQAQLSRG